MTFEHFNKPEDALLVSQMINQVDEVLEGGESMEYKIRVISNFIRVAEGQLTLIKDPQARILLEGKITECKQWLQQQPG